MTGKIVLKGLTFYGYHGVLEAEAVLGARFVVDVEMELLLPVADDLSQTVDYSHVYALVEHEVTQQRNLLIEALAHRIAKRIIQEHSILQSLLVRVHKPQAPLPGSFDDVFVEVSYDAR